MTEVAQQQWTYDEVAITMAQHLHAYAHNNGPDLEAEDLAIPCDAFSIEKRKAKWTKVKRDRLNLIGARFEALRPKIEEAKAKQAEPSAQSAGMFRRYKNVGSSFFGPATQPTVESSVKDNGPRKAVEHKEEIVFENWSAETKRAAKTKTLVDWPDAPEPPAGATDLERLTYPRGLLGHVVEYIYSTAQLPDRFMALAGALSACGKCLDRKVLGPTGNSTILYILLIAETGSGKQHIINCIRMVLRAAGMEETIVASGIASVQAIEEILEGRGEKIAGQPSPLVLLDEYGSFLNRISSKGQTGNVAEIPGILQTLWGWPPELEWTGSIKVLKERVTVLGPAFAIFATSTERAFFTALKSKQVASGFVNRHALINAGRGAAKRIKPAHHWTQCPNWLVQALQKVSGDPVPNAGAPLVLQVDGKETMLRDFRRIGWGPGAEECWSDFENEEIRALPSIEDRELWIRAPEIALRLATILAVFRGSATVEVEDLKWSIVLIRQSTKQLSRGLQKHMLEEYAQADLVAYIREQFRLVGILTIGQLRKLCERKTDDHRKIDHAIDHLVMCGDIEEVGSSGPGRPTRRWKWIG